MNRSGNASGIKSFVILVAFCFLFAVALLLNVQYLYIMSVTLALLPAVSYVIGSVFAARYAIVRKHASTTTEGRAIPVKLHIAARGGLPQTALRLEDSLPTELLPDKTAPSPARLAAPELWDGRVGERTYSIEPNLRGVYKIGPARLEISDPLGLFTFQAKVAATSELVVHPTPLPLREYMGGGAGRFGPREREGRTRRGEGLDFHGVREYRPGEALRRVHWRTSARRGRLVTVEFERAYQQNLVIALDLGADTVHGSGRDSTLEYAIKAAATLIDRTLRDGGGVTLLTQYGIDEIRAGEPDVDTARFRLFDKLARARAESPDSLADSLREISDREQIHLAVLTTRGESALLAHLAERIRRGDSIRIFFLEPGSFGGPQATSPAVAGASLRLIRRQDSPWTEGGSRLEYLLRETN